MIVGHFLDLALVTSLDVAEDLEIAESGTILVDGTEDHVDLVK
jgi:hypothetical protein